MSNNTSVSGITSPTQYTLLDNNHKYLPRNFTFIPTVSSESENNITETVKSALDNNYYYTCTALDFVYKIDVNNDLKDVVYKVDNKSAYVYKISSGENVAYKYCESSKVDINVLYNNGVNNIDISNVTVIKGEDVLTPIATNLSFSCTVSDDKKITVPENYNSLEINNHDVFFRQKNNNENPSWVTINKNDDKKIVSFSNNLTPTQNIIEFSDNNFNIKLGNNIYYFYSMIETDLINAYAELTREINKISLIVALGHEISALVKTAQDANIYLSKEATTDLNSAASALKKASDLNSAESALSSAASALSSAESALSSAATNLGNAASALSSAANALKEATDLNSAANALKKGFSFILNTSLSLKQGKLFNIDDGSWKKENDVLSDDRVSLSNIKTNLITFRKEVIKGFDNTEFGQSFQGLKFIYAIYKSTDNIGLVDMSTKDVVVNQSPVIKKILKYKGLDLSDIKSIKMFALDNENKMIIYKNSDNSDNSYNLVYLENNGQNGNRILPEGDSFIPTTNPTEP